MGKKAKYAIARNKYESYRGKRKISKTYLAILFAMCEGKCPSCNVDMVLGFSYEIGNLPNSATLDHVNPLSYELEHKKFGLQIMCKDCNSRKGKIV